MMNRTFWHDAWALACCAGAPSAAPRGTPRISGRQGRSGKLPPVAERLPKNPRVVNLAAMGRSPASMAAKSAC